MSDEEKPPETPPDTALVPRRQRGNRTSAQKFKSVELRREVVKLRTEGLSLQQIATQKGVSRQAIHRHLKVAMEHATKLETLEVDHHREINARRCDLVIESMMPGLREGDPGCASQVLKAVERLSKLYGLESPVKTELTGKDGGPVQVATTFANLLELARGAKNNGQ